MTAWAAPGVKCVCVDAGPERNTGRPVGLVKGATYVVERIDARHPRGLIGVHIQGVSSYSQFGLAIERFRPLLTRSQEQDVAKFRHLLVPSPIDAGLVPAGVELDA